MKRVASLLLALVLVLCSFAAIGTVSATAEDAGSITLNVLVEFDDNGNRSQIPLEGLKLNVYRVWSYKDAQIDGTTFNGELVLADYLKDAPELKNVNNADLPFKSKELMELSVGQTPDYVVETDANGVIKMENLPLGGYLFVQPEVLNYKGNDWSIAQFVLTLPQKQLDGSWSTELNVSPKVSMQAPKLLTEVAGEKLWSKPSEVTFDITKPITVRLWCNGIEVASRVVSAQTGWKYAFTELPKFDDEGRENVYTVTEDPIEGYEVLYNGYNITNSYNPDFTQINVVKHWDDQNDTLGYRPASITVHLLRDGKRFGEAKVLTYATGWQASWTNLLVKAEDGHEYVYSVEEEPVELYTANLDETQKEIAIIINNQYIEFPRTGDETNIWLYGAIFVMSVIATAVLALERKAQKR